MASKREQREAARLLGQLVCSEGGHEWVWKVQGVHQARPLNICKVCWEPRFG